MKMAIEVQLIEAQQKNKINGTQQEESCRYRNHKQMCQIEIWAGPWTAEDSKALPTSLQIKIFCNKKNENKICVDIR